ncbi:MAG TPA: HAMP domain-containing histidine kinase [candidate division WOR-3 bacterium]|uniref:histidine kinase n=1 Tax=candidate division WOR-3 bacterium TaxID=2052148 RepID=A0A7V5HNF1_UNCW3|nr:HAMP domain-containing histidine kinase [candidate division WOR-3 bacterium]
MEFSRELRNGYFIVGGYSLEYMDEFERRAKKNFIIVLLVLIVSAIISLFLVVKLENLILKREIALREEAALRKHFEELSALSSAVSHEIKNPLNTLSLLLDRLKEKGTVEEKYLSIIENEIARMNRIVDQFRNIARPVTMKKETCRLRDIIDKALSSVRVELGMPSIKVEVDVPGAMVLSCDSDLMNQVFYNLIKNAFEAIEDSGTIYITARKSGKKIIIELKDTGKGMDEETLSKAMSFFYTTKTHGLGIGLAISRRIIEAHGGRLYVKSQPGKGTLVIIEMEAQDV